MPMKRSAWPESADGMDTALGQGLLLPYCCQAPGGASRAFYLFTGFAGKIESRRADSNRFPAPATSALLAIWVRPKGLLAELRPYPPNASTNATLNGGLVVAPTHRCRRIRIAPHYSSGTHHFQLPRLILAQ